MSINESLNLISNTDQWPESPFWSQEIGTVGKGFVYNKEVTFPKDRDIKFSIYAQGGMEGGLFSFIPNVSQNLADRRD